MLVDEFDYRLPPELIAQEPLDKRDRSRLMVLKRTDGSIEHRRFTDLLSYLREGDVLVLNNTRVIPARLMGCKKNGGALAEILLLHRRSEKIWETLVRPGKRLRPGQVIVFNNGEITAEITSVLPEGRRLVEFNYTGNFAEIIERLGEMPLPPYIKTKLKNRQRYQTVYAENEGSVAAPTAGLHFTPFLLDEIRRRKVATVYLTLHVGLGTFRPVKEKYIEDHQMHSEYYHMPDKAAQTINNCREKGGRIIAVGTTSCRTLETLADDRGRLRGGSGWTDLFIYPGYRFKATDMLLTNFHLPKSTLLMLVSAFAGREKTLHAYRQAVEKRYRFFSFGDAMLIV